jgi:hypothetical protein
MTDAVDQFIPDPDVCKEFHITPMTLWRWDRDEKLGFPPPIKIRNRNFRSRNALEAFKAKMLRFAIESRAEAAA